MPARSLGLFLFFFMGCLPPYVNAAPTTFVHPGIEVDKGKLEYVKRRLSDEPWRTSYQSTKNDPLAGLNYRPTPHATVECGPYSKPDHGCKDEIRDAQAAYTQALLWFLSGDARYARNSRAILDAWATTLVGGHTNKNAALQASWAAQLFTRAAEIISHTDGGWDAQQKSRFGDFLSEQYLPQIRGLFSGRNSCYNGNWHASAIEAMVNIAIFTDNRRLFDEAVSNWRKFVPSYIYLKKDGPSPVRLPWCKNGESSARWHSPASYLDGLTQESCRDFEHTAYGLAAILNVAETARLQGLSLYKDKEVYAEARLSKAMELHSAYQNGAPGLGPLCKRYSGIKRNTKGTFGLGYGFYGAGLGVPMPQTEKFLRSTGPARGNFHYIWESFINAQPMMEE